MAVPPVPKRLTVVQTLPTLESGGVERGTLETAAALVAAGHRSIVLSGGGRLVPELAAAGSEHICWPIGRKSPATLALVPKLVRLCRRERVDVLHARSRVPAWAALMAHRMMPAATRPRLVTTMHGLHSVGRFSSVMTRGEHVVAVSRTVAEHIARHYPRCPPDRVSVIRNGIDHAAMRPGEPPPERWRRDFESQFPNTVGRRLVTLTGRLTRLKGHHDFLQVISRLPPEWHGLIVGGDDPNRLAYADDLRRQVGELGLTDRVTLTGHRADVSDIAAASEAVVSLSTRPESFGRTVLEALAIGTPVVGYSHGGVGEVLAELCPQGRVGVGDLVGVAERLQTIAARGERPSPFTEFALSETCSRMVALYESACGAGSESLSLAKAA